MALSSAASKTTSSISETREYRLTKRKRDNAVAELNAIRRFADTFDIKTKSVSQLQVRLEQLPALTDEFNSRFNELEQMDDRDEDIHSDVKSAFMETLWDTKAALLELLDGKRGVNSSCGTIPLSEMQTSRGFIKLPPVTAPKFNGDLQEWPSFIDEFNAMFHNNDSIAPVQKFHYLKSCLSGPAADLIKVLPTTEENYTQAYDTLMKRYENVGLVIQSHIRSLFATPKVLKASADEIRQLHQHVTAHVRALKSLRQPVEHWDAWLVTLICGQLDATTAGEWQFRQTSNELPTYASMEEFLARRVAAYEIETPATSVDKNGRIRQQNTNFKSLFTHMNERPSAKCACCQGLHKIYSCDQFKNMPIVEKRIVINRAKLCFNCLNSGHQVKQCKSSTCTKCGKKHNTLLHQVEALLDNHDSMSVQLEPTQQLTSSSSHVVNFSNAVGARSTVPTSQIVLATAMVKLCDGQGRFINCRAVLDSGSQLCFVTERVVRQLGLHISHSQVDISAIGQTQMSSRKCCVGTVQSRVGTEEYQVQLQILPNITDNLPTQTFDARQLSIPEMIQTNLADPYFNVQSPVDMLLGAEIFYKILKRDKYEATQHAMFQETALGWIFSGHIPNTHSQTAPDTSYSYVGVPVDNASSNSNSALSLISTKRHVRSQEELAAEEHFKTHVKRDQSGRFVVSLPLTKSVNELGNSLHMARTRFYNLEKRLQRDKGLAADYDQFMQEYLSNGHMEIVENGATQGVYYLPHHAVLKSDSITTKTRVVFDASAVTTTGVSLNDILMRGPTVQSDLFSILLRFRVHPVVITADVEKMYRQVRVSPSDCDLQRIVYRSSPELPLIHYRLLTVTYGTKPAPYLATRCLAELAAEVQEPTVQRAIRQDFYVDDFISGATSVTECTQLYASVSKILMSASMPLRKWCSNSPEVLEQIPTSTSDPTYLLNLSEDDTISTLGLSWQPSVDQFKFLLKEWVPVKVMTKRTLLSDMNKVYDPLGFLTPILIKGKIFMQQLWSLKMDWDTHLSTDLQVRWQNFYQSLGHVRSFTIPRFVGYRPSQPWQLHGFCDASQNAYGACIYIRSRSHDGNWSSVLLTSKSRVAPMHATTIPRLELCGATLLAELLADVVTELTKITLTLSKTDIVLWTDSSIVLSWIKTSLPLKSFVSNRVARILDVTDPSQWNHVPTDQNPADLISRGVSCVDLADMSLWWNGPHWLIMDASNWPISLVKLLDNPPEVKPTKLVLSMQVQETWLLNKYSTWSTLIRITALVFRFISYCRVRNGHRNHINSFVTSEELATATKFWIKQVQLTYFSAEIASLNSGNLVNRNSSLKSLSPFIDDQGVIRVGGRLSNAPIPYESKCPIILTAKSRFTKLLFEYEHKRLLHVGPQSLLSIVSGKYWIIGGRNIARQTVKKCVQCFRFRPKFAAPFMASLPKDRVTIARAFAKSGVDLCGPIGVRSGLRKVASVKNYVCVFVCMVTRAIHLEVVSSLSSDEFLAALSRFMARRGQCLQLFSDNGTNFVGSNRILQAHFKELAATKKVSDFLTEQSITWQFIPPSAPHFGGLWESSVKSAKHHLLKVTRGDVLKQDELVTLLCKIEAVLNSRPLTSMSTDPSDYTALTPGHFLVGGNLMLPPEPDVSSVPQNRLRRFKLVQQQLQGFWKRWTKEYLPQLNKRGKWTQLTRKIAINDLAILRDETLPPMRWPLVRVIKVHPGQDGEVRVVTVRTASGLEFKRPAVKLAVLPTETDDDEETQPAIAEELQSFSAGENVRA